MRLLKKKLVKMTSTLGFALVGSRKELVGVGALGENEKGNTYKLFGNLGNFLTVDPGLGGTGWALWSRMQHDELVPPIDSGSISSPTKNRPWWWHAAEIADRLGDIARRSTVMVVYAELPQFMEAGKGLAAARDGDLVKLTTVFGAVMGKLCNNQSSIFCPVPIMEWKGNMPKDILEPRIRAKLPKWRPKTDKSHEMDAVGIGLFVKGHL